ncbi:1,2-phenylacetyl-CoA epoxidase subunit PaaC [Cytobacillus luteolus]|nr:1,2-phenylacetyl-CoA epoxidase subunit PaaC [Cytobacillus luteolus]MBP1944538.1 ring-1,2-phenylacetyl-CoA epoxidase subunit PaaC [Cytobacillus luteolus]
MTANNDLQFLSELLFQLADDDFIISYRGSEWLGLAPHIEEDVAFSSISQDTMGHAAMFYQLLEDIGVGKVDDLAHSRTSTERKNAVLLELVNGPGNYLRQPQYDWAFAVVRNYFYTQAKKIRVESLKTSSYQPLADVAVKVNMELYYHLLHWKTWFTQLMMAGGDARTRMEKAVQTVVADFEGMLTLGPKGKEMAELGFIDTEEVLKTRTINAMKPIFESINLDFPSTFEMKNGNGRIGQHTADLDDALSTLSEVYNINPVATW